MINWYIRFDRIRSPISIENSRIRQRIKTIRRRIHHRTAFNFVRGVFTRVVRARKSAWRKFKFLLKTRLINPSTKSSNTMSIFNRRDFETRPVVTRSYEKNRNQHLFFPSSKCINRYAFGNVELLSFRPSGCNVNPILINFSPLSSIHENHTYVFLYLSFANRFAVKCRPPLN